MDPLIVAPNGKVLVAIPTVDGTISPSLGKLKFLRHLDLSNLRQLVGPIPPELGKFIQPYYYFPYSNQLEGSIPASFQNLRKLNGLYLSENRLSGTIPTSVFQHMSSLLELVIYDNQLSGGIPSSIDKLVFIEEARFPSKQFLRKYTKYNWYS
ncbi:hypothetical protein MKX03_028826 [Papaver bracteatum]|nr:hypothetical protein MKX03_028826 [Papaver bracteatum]